MSATFFASAAAFRRWLEQHHATATELHVGFNKKTSGLGGLTYLEAVEQALCFGWIDGVVRRLDDQRYQHRFTPRRRDSIWSNVNVAHVERLAAAGQMHPAGLAAFQARTPAKTGVYRHEQTAPAPLVEKFPAALEKQFREVAPAWTFWTKQPPGYRRRLITWIVSAKQSTTRETRLARLIAASRAQKRLTS